MKRVMLAFFLTIIAILACFSRTAWCEERQSAPSLRLVRAVMCESIKEYEPVHPAVVFSIERGRVSCFTAFDRISEKTYVFHSWYRRDSLVTVKRLTINPPKWSSFTSVQLRDADIGPWRVEIMDENKKLLHTLRFSIAE
jgi:hypothetical protein